MKIAIVLHPYGEKKPAGLARSMFETVKGILTVDSRNEYLILLKNKPQIPPPLPGTNWRYKVLGHKFLWFTNKLARVEADLFIFLTPVIPIFFKPKKTIVVVYDFAYKYATDASLKLKIFHHFLHFINSRSLRLASHIIAISDFTKSEIVKYFGIPEEKITVIPLGYNKICDSPQQKVEGVFEPYFLFAGVIKERKNVFSIVRAFQLFKSNDKKGVRLVIAGKGGGDYHQKILKFIEWKNFQKDVVFLDHMNDNQLSYLYSHALALVFPSLLEGFGMPILEAMDCGLPAITSNRGALKEVAADGALLIDPENVEDITSAMARVAVDSNLREHLIKKGYEISARYSWIKSAQKYINLFDAME